MVNRLTHDAEGKRIKKAVPEDARPVKSEPKKTHNDKGSRIKYTSVPHPTSLVEQKYSDTFASKEYEILRDLASSEWASLKSTTDRKVKAEKQKALLEKYREFLTAYMSAGESYHNVILFYCLVWASDAKAFDYAIALADYIVKTGQHFELGFKRNAVTICCDEIMLKQEQVFEQDKVLTAEFLAVFERLKAKQWRVDNVVTHSKFYRMAGRFAEESGDMQQAYDYYCEADTINPKAGVKKMIERTKSLI